MVSIKWGHAWIILKGTLSLSLQSLHKIYIQVVGQLYYCAVSLICRRFGFDDDNVIKNRIINLSTKSIPFIYIIIEGIHMYLSNPHILQ